MEKGKVVVKEIKKKEDPKIVYNIKHENFYTIGSQKPIKIATKKEFAYGECGYCKYRFIIEDQKYCESCGYEL